MRIDLLHEVKGITWPLQQSLMPKEGVCWAFLPSGLKTLSMRGNDMIGTIVQFIKQNGSSQQTMSIDQPPRVVIDAIRHGTPKFVREQLKSGTVETIDILMTELNEEKHPQGKGERVETILVKTLDWLK